MATGSGLHILYPQNTEDPEATLDIVAVHGLNGHHMDSWTTKSRLGKKTMWLRDLLPERFPEARIMTFEYNAKAVTSASPHGIAENGGALIQALRNKREENVSETRLQHGVSLSLILSRMRKGGRLYSSCTVSAASSSRR